MADFMGRVASPEGVEAVGRSTGGNMGVEISVVAACGGAGRCWTVATFTAGGVRSDGSG